jgi:hypothetical protein
MENAELWSGDHVGHEAKKVGHRMAKKSRRSRLCSGFGRGVLTKNLPRYNCARDDKSRKMAQKKSRCVLDSN